MVSRGSDLQDMAQRPADQACPAVPPDATIQDPQILAHPNAFYHALRTHDPVRYAPKLDMYLVSRFEDLQTVVRDPLTFSVAHGYEEQYAKGFAEELNEILVRDGGGHFEDIIMRDPPQHTRPRRLMENRFVEELLRIEPPVRGLSRMTTREVELGGVKLPAHAHLLLLFGSANDDETEFACPRAFDLDRPNLGRHVAFSAGVHRCIGAPLARMEIRVAAREIIRRMDKIELAAPAQDIRYLPTVATHSIASLPLRFARQA